MGQRTSPRLPPGFRWIAVRPGAAPLTGLRRRALGPTPRYAVTPRWGLTDYVDQAPASTQPTVAKGPDASAVRTTLFITVVVLGVAALFYVLRYVLLIINRTILLNSVLAAFADWLGVLISVVAIMAVFACALVLIVWLIARRAAAFAHNGLVDHRSARQLWLGCLLPLANLLWAPVFVIELANIEDQQGRQQRPIVVWWVIWVFSYLVSIFAIATRWSSDPQGIANNTVLMVFAYFVAAATVAAIARIFEGFVRKPVERPVNRWVVVGADQPGASATARPVELQGQEPAA